MSGVGWKGWLALVIFTLQDGSDAVIGQFVLQQRPPFSARTYTLERGGISSAARQLVSDTRRRPEAWAHMSIPALLYTGSAVLQVIGAANLDAPVVKL
eukprot:455857-Prymnesium_polylepis.1